MDFIFFFLNITEKCTENGPNRLTTLGNTKKFNDIQNYIKICIYHYKLVYKTHTLGMYSNSYILIQFLKIIT